MLSIVGIGSVSILLYILINGTSSFIISKYLIPNSAVNFTLYEGFSDPSLIIYGITVGLFILLSKKNKIIPTATIAFLLYGLAIIPIENILFHYSDLSFFESLKNYYQSLISFITTRQDIFFSTYFLQYLYLLCLVYFITKCKSFFNQKTKKLCPF